MLFTRKWRTNLLAILLFVGIFGCFVMLAAASQQRPATATAGLDGVLSTGSITPLMAARSQPALDTAMQASAIGDNDGVVELLRSGAVVYVEQPARILILDDAGATTKVRLLDGSYKGEAVWVPSEWIRHN